MKKEKERMEENVEKIMGIGEIEKEEELNRWDLWAILRIGE